MKLSVDALSKHGGFAGGPVKRVVEWFDAVNGEMVNADVWVRPLSYHNAVNDIEDGGTANVIARRIAMSICDEDGGPIFRISDITGVDENGAPIMIKNDKGDMVERGPLPKDLSDNLISLIGEVSGLGKRPKTTKPTKTKK